MKPDQADALLDEWLNDARNVYIRKRMKLCNHCCPDPDGQINSREESHLPAISVFHII